MPMRILVLMAALLGCAGIAQARTYTADRFDSRIEVQREGTLRVTETVVFRFESGTFTEVFRELRTRRTDGIEVVSASMDGNVFAWGGNPGEAEVTGTSRVRVKWRFAPVADSTHTFELVYLVKGAVRQEDGADLVAWRALPDKHDYRIASSTIDFELPDAPAAPPEIDVRRVGHHEVAVDGTRVRILAGAIRSNGWMVARIRLPLGTVVQTPPAWQRRADEQRERAPIWFATAGLVMVAGLVLLFAVRQSYDSPPRDSSTVMAGPAFPDTLAPAEAGAIAANGSPRLEHAMATLLSLAERGELTIIEEPGRSLGQRRFTIIRRPARRPGAPYEEAVLDAIFTKGGETTDSVSLDKARSRLVRRFQPFSRALQSELNADGLIDSARKSVRARYQKIGLVFLIAGLVLPGPIALLILDAYGAWPMLIPLALLLVAVVAFICHAAHTPLSNEGVRRARYWRAFQAYLKDLAHDRTAAPSTQVDRLLPYAVALGLAGAWSKFLKQHRAGAPAWFHAAAADDIGPAFVAFVAHGGAGTGAGAGAGGGGVAGGGSSGAR